MKHSLFQGVKRIALFGVILAISGAFAACKTDSDPDPGITFKNFINSSGYTITVSGSGKAVFDWGGGFGKETVALADEVEVFPPYTDYAKPYTVTLTGKEITELNVNEFHVKSVSIRKMGSLKELMLHSNELTALNVSACPKLEYLKINDNNLNGGALNALFKSLPDRNGKTKGVILFYNNPGESSCELSLLAAKNWEED